MADTVRIDKYIWAIRLYKTRSEATEACNGNKVQINSVNAKPSKPVRIGDIITTRKGPVQYTFKVIQLSEQRMGAALVSQYAEDLTPESEIEKRKAPVETFFVRRERGTGRPTKKERRDLDALWENLDD